ncbi:MAG: TOBE domain-containing protein [Thermoanaerobacteraceae bacterium]|nr:TOBE domain-containing protein [Thermoanaerobacteraceae bacterium]
MKISGRNQLRGTVRHIATDGLMAKVVVDIGGRQSITALITGEAANDLGLAVGDRVTALIKATSVMIVK